MNDPGFNRPMAEMDWQAVMSDPLSVELRALVDDYKQAGLPVMNGSMKYSSFNEGPAHVFTLNPYRLWEYTSILKLVEAGAKPVKFLDVGGAGAALAYHLAERGHAGVAVDINPLPVAICKGVSQARKLPLQSIVADATSDMTGAGADYDLITLVSVLEHIPERDWPQLFLNLRQLLKPGGLLYITFDYGDYFVPEPLERSLAQIGPLAEVLKETGWKFKGNDPVELPPEWLALRAAPQHGAYGREYWLNLGAVDGGTSWFRLLKHQVKRLVAPFKSVPTRCARHNFFRLLLEK